MIKETFSCLQMTYLEFYEALFRIAALDVNTTARESSELGDLIQEVRQANQDFSEVGEQLTHLLTHPLDILLTRPLDVLLTHPLYVSFGDPQCRRHSSKYKNYTHRKH